MSTFGGSTVISTGRLSLSRRVLYQAGLCYFQESCESCGDAILDLVDYSHRRLVALMAGEEGEGPRKRGMVQEMESDGEEGSDSENEEDQKRKEIVKASR